MSIRPLAFSRPLCQSTHAAALAAVLTLSAASVGAAQESADAPAARRWPSATQQAAAPNRSVSVAVSRDPIVNRSADRTETRVFERQAATPADRPFADPADQNRLEQRRSPGGGGDRGGARGGDRGGNRGDGGGPRVAVPRDGSGPGPSGRPGSVGIRPRAYYTPRYYYPYSYSYFGPGYYDSFWWGDAGYGYGYGPGWRGAGVYGGGYPYGGYQGYDVGRLRLQVRPRDAEVFIDGYYAGQVDDFDGRLQGLSLETGGYSVEVRKTGWETLTFDVRVTPGRTTNYRGELIPQRP